jgi:hypothetical protein
MCAALPSLSTPALDRLVARWAEVRRDDGDAHTLSPPHERAHAAALGLTGADGSLPWAAHQAALDGVAVGGRAWGLLTPVHWRVGSDGVQMTDPASLALSDGESRALFEAVQPLFAREGYAMAWGAAVRWYVAHDSLRGLATASLDRVVGRNIDAWLPRQTDAKPLRRLQNEAQMLLHTHPLNEVREAAGALAVNSFWLSGCGAAQPAAAGDVGLDDSLRGPALQDDAPAWRDAWRRLDERGLAPLAAAAARGDAVRLTLCGERSSVELAPPAGSLQSAWRRMIATFAPAQSRTGPLLESL